MMKVCEDVTISTKDFSKIETLLFKLAKRYNKVYFNSDNELSFYKSRLNGIIYVTFMHWNTQHGTGIIFAFANESGNLLNRNDWRFCTYENANYLQQNSIIGSINSPYSWDNYEKIKVEA